MLITKETIVRLQSSLNPFVRVTSAHTLQINENSNREQSVLMKSKENVAF